MLTIGTSAFGCLTPPGKSIQVGEQVEILLRTLFVRQSKAKERCWRRRKIHVEMVEPEAGIEVAALVTIISGRDRLRRSLVFIILHWLHRVSIRMDIKSGNTIRQRTQVISADRN